MSFGSGPDVEARGLDWLTSGVESPTEQSAPVDSQRGNNL